MKIEYTYVIIKSYKKGGENWSGKEFSSFPAKIYSTFDDAIDALKGYWFNAGAIEINSADKRAIKIIHLSEKQKEKLLAQGSIRW